MSNDQRRRKHLQIERAPNCIANCKYKVKVDIRLLKKDATVYHHYMLMGHIVQKLIFSTNTTIKVTKY